MSLARKCKPLCRTFQNFPAVFSVINKELSTAGGSGGDGNSGNNGVPQVVWDASYTSNKSNPSSNEAVVINPSLCIDGSSGPMSSVLPSVDNIGDVQGKPPVLHSNYSTSTPIIPDSEFPLPGNIGISQEFNNLLISSKTASTAASKKEGSAFVPKLTVFSEALGYNRNDISNDLFSYGGGPLPIEEQRILTLQKVVNVLNAINARDNNTKESNMDFESFTKLMMDYNGPIEVCTFVCPQFVLKQLLPLFPAEMDLGKSSLTMINLTHKTVNDMSAWNDKVEEEREEVIQKFVQGAQIICEFFKLNKYFADFIDPATGKPFYSKHTNASLFETDELYERFGFRIDDLGCCKVIHHGTFGTHVFVGTILTDAPLSENFLKT